MDMYAMGIATGALQMVNTATTTTTEAPAGDNTFAMLLTQLAGGQTADGQTSATPLTGLTWRDIQAGMMTEAMGALADAERPITTDPVLAQLLSLLKNLSTEDAGGMQQLEDLIAQMQDRLREILEESGAEVAGQQVLALFAFLMQDATGIQMDANAQGALSADGGNALLEMMLQSAPQDILQMLTGTPTPQENTGTDATFTLPEQAAPSAQTPQAPAQAEVPITEVQYSPPTPTADFEAAVRTVKQQMEHGDTEQTGVTDQTLDVDELQQRVNAGEYLQNTPLAVQTEAPQAPAPAAPALDVQMWDAVQAAIETGEGELTVTLMPENLGEVTIQLTRSAEGGMMLNIIAQNAETQSLLANGAESLRASLQPLGVQVESIQTQQQYTAADAQGQFGGQQQRQNTPMHGAAYYRDEPLTAAQSPQEMPAPPVYATPQSALDAYI
ncbi:flagellar hook-length control protein FliK [Ruminococcaceae bacterium OttesenSCG-928-O06]|nr:flagellar hook-length control protein FliK [Ruminococcaceae bacterium OttesenSCG-928-O06]